MIVEYVFVVVGVVVGASCDSHSVIGVFADEDRADKEVAEVKAGLGYSHAYWERRELVR